MMPKEWNLPNSYRYQPPAQNARQPRAGEAGNIAVPGLPAAVMRRDPDADEFEDATARGNPPTLKLLGWRPNQKLTNKQSIHFDELGVGVIGSFRHSAGRFFFNEDIWQLVSDSLRLTGAECSMSPHRSAIGSLLQ